MDQIPPGIPPVGRGWREGPQGRYTLPGIDPPGAIPVALLLTLALIFIVIAVGAWLLGARGFAGFTWGIAKFLIIIFVLLFLITLVLGLGGLG